MLEVLDCRLWTLDLGQRRLRPRNGIERWRVSGTSSEAIPTVVVGGGFLFSASGRNGPTMAVRPGGYGRPDRDARRLA